MKTRSPATGQGCLTLFALPFAGFGTYMAIVLLKTLWLFAAVQQWQPVPAEILEVELQSHRGSKSTSYETTVRYQYEFAGQSYVGERVGLESGGDNVGDWQEQIYGELRACRDAGQPFRAYVDPADPSRALLYRELRWGLAGLQAIFVLVFGGVGYGLIVAGFIGKKRLQRDAELKARHPDQPWRQREDWAAGEVRSNARPTMFFSLIFATFWNLISLPLLFLLPEEILRKGNRLAALGLLFPLVGAGLLVWAVRSVIRVRKFGNPSLQLQTLPATVGQRLSGVVHTGKLLRPEQGFTLTLDGVNRRTTGSGRNRSTSEQIVHQESRPVRPEELGRDASGTTIPVRFAIPGDAPPTDDSDPDNRILWRLTVTAELPGVDYASSFEVPVFRSAASSADPEPAEPRAESPRAAELLPQPGLQLRREGDCTVVTLAPARHPGAALALTAFLLVWSGVVALLLTLQAPLFFTTLFGLVDLLILYGAIDLWCGAVRIEVRPGELRRRGGLFARGRWRSWRLDEIDHFEPKPGLQSGRKLYYDLQLVPRQGRTRTLASRLNSRAQAEALARELAAALRGA